MTMDETNLERALRRLDPVEPSERLDREIESLLAEAPRRKRRQV